jgi:hypothetical protein
MKSIQKQIESSTCFGVAYDSSIKECKICEINQECKSKSEGANVTKPEPPVKKEVLEKTTKAEVPAPKVKASKAENKPSTEKKAKEKEKKPSAADSIDFKAMTMEELETMAEERKADPSWKNYDNAGIRRMRCTMAIKKTF